MTRKIAEMWKPWQINESMKQRGGRFASAMARLKPGVSPEQAQAEMNAIEPGWSNSTTISTPTGA